MSTTSRAMTSFMTSIGSTSPLIETSGNAGVHSTKQLFSDGVMSVAHVSLGEAFTRSGDVRRRQAASGTRRRWRFCCSPWPSCVRSG